MDTQAHSGSQPRKSISSQALIVWFSGVLVYIAAIASRTSFGVAGVEAIDRFQVDATRIAVFTSVQIGVYALCQIPMGLLIDRFGPRKLLTAGALIMGSGQILLGLTDVYSIAISARVLIGAGDATVFLSVMRLLPFWFPLRWTPLFTQLTSGLGQLGQFISAVPFMALLRVSGWTTSFVVLGSAVAIAAFAALIAVRDNPSSAHTRNQLSATDNAPRQKPPFFPSLTAILKNPVCWQGFFIHYTLMIWQIVFTMMWGVPLMSLGMDMDPATIALVLSLNTLFSIIAGPIMGLISARLGYRRDFFAIALSIFPVISWLVFLSSSEPRGLLALVIINFAMAATTPASSFGFDTIREQLDRKILASATGLANMGGFIAGMVGAQLLGFLLDHSAQGAAYSWDDFQKAFTAVIFLWSIGVGGFIIARFKGGTTRKVIIRHIDQS